MRGYARFRIFLLLALLGAATYLASDGFAQPATQASAPAAPVGLSDPSVPAAEAKPKGLINLIMENLDPVFFTIAALSVTGLTLIIQGFIKNRQSVFMPETSTNTIREMIEQRKFRELIDFTENDPSFVSKALNPALKRAPSFASMKEAMETAIGEQTAEQFRKIEYLNIIGNLGPLLGLLGTVLGMIHAFSTMQAKGGATTPADLAGGVSIALTHTFLGLFLAIPCLAAFGVLRTIVDRLTVRGALVAEEMLLMIKPAEARPMPVASVAPGAAAGAAPVPRPPSIPQPAVPRVATPPYPAPPTA
ncbi:MAG: MotA/TolQ/ExbB proton channel family protein [Tepidisphaeraceae bacterium]